jgi:hypothetical protein
MSAQSHKFVFLCGLHRSGTSPLFRILREHPQISGFRNTGVPEDEGQHLQSVFPPAKAHGGPGRFGFAPEAHLTEKSALVNADNRDRLFHEWSRHWDLSRPYLLEKSPPNLIRTRLLQKLFPDSYFIVIYRHPIAVSLATWKWARTGMESLMEHWLVCHRLFQQDRAHLRHVLEIKYEDLIQNGGITFPRIYQFLGLEPRAALHLNPAGNARYFAVWRQLAKDPKGRTTFHHLVAKYEQQVRHYGYSFTDAEGGLSSLRPTVPPNSKFTDT